MNLKNDLLSYYRNGIEEYVVKALNKEKNSDRSALINKEMKKLLDNVLNNKDRVDMNYVLMANYTYYIVMLESRNKVWNYDYMAFSRRIGELWEPFCKLAFEYASKNLSFYEPMKYEDYKNKLSVELERFITELNLPDDKEIMLHDYIEKLWALSESGSINLSEDLHFEQDDVRYVVDFKSGFSSNEKGNVNRLLQVAKIYSTIDYQCILFVRQPEEENNHYLQILKNSGLWDVYCYDETYQKIYDLTGVDLKKWMSENMNWSQDISPEFRDYLQENNLSQYLTW